MSERPVSAGLRVDSENPGHAVVSVFVGRTPGARGHAGTLTLRTDELTDLGHLNSDGQLVVAFDWIERPCPSTE